MFTIRLKAIASSLVFLIIGIGAFYFSIIDIIGYFEFQDEITYSWGDCFAFVFSFVVFIFSLYPIYVAFYGSPMPICKAKKTYKIALVFFVASLVSPVIFSYVYTGKLESLGYIACRGTPLGWTPMMATKYVTDKKRCLAPKK
ncbi:hypothetical protein [Morganella sp. GD04133]|uniref:hypothetical protein n=1 Tax=Morganella sp. GD04133 TaxID=2975435 RepID=UPI002449E781|nr:hypothetical protein [Morganella sp. GD04133]MDH0356835.1 hypothetical protein [Morganella sp. GD04133]